MYKCINCAYKGEEAVDNLFCPVCGDYLEGKKPGEIKILPDERMELDKKEFEAKPKEPEEIIELRKKPNLKNRVKDFVEDIMDDGKRNYSNDPRKKSPGRKKGD